MNILFIAFTDPNSESNFGGVQVSQRNYLALKEMADVYTYVILKKNALSSILSLVEGCFPPSRTRDTRNILKVISERHIDIVWFDSSHFGITAKKIKQSFPNIILLGYYCNIERDYIRVRLKKGLKLWLYNRNIKIQEELFTNTVDEHLMITDRDGKRMQELYGNDKSYQVIPVSFKDMMYADLSVNKEIGFNGIFVGAYGRANLESICWFLKNTSLDKDITIRIIGKNFENHIAEITSITTSVNVEVIGTVEDMAPLYLEADFVLAPIIIGGGMKVKVAEAMMYGKTIIGTPEAFAGYDVDFNRIGICTEDIKQMDEAIWKCQNGIFGNRYNQYSRECYLEKYSDTAINRIFDSILRPYIIRG